MSAERRGSFPRIGNQAEFSRDEGTSVLILQHTVDKCTLKHGVKGGSHQVTYYVHDYGIRYQVSGIWYDGSWVWLSPVLQ